MGAQLSLGVTFWLAISIAFEVAGDIGVKEASIQRGWGLWALTILFYNAMLIAWFLAINNAKNITLPGTIWLTMGQLALVGVGCYGLFREKLSGAQIAGVALATISLILLSLGEAKP